MTQAVAVNVKQIVLNLGAFGPQEIDQIAEALTQDPANHRALREAVNEMEVGEDRSPAAAVRLGVCYYLLGRYHQAIETLKTGDGGALAHFYMGSTNAALEQFDAALQNYTSAAKAGYNADACLLAKAEALRIAGKPQAALDRSITCPARSSRRPNISTSAARRSPPSAAIRREVVALYERAVEADPQSSGALFGLAVENDRRGNDEAALDLYERSVAQFPDARRLAAEPGHAVRRSPAVRPGPAVLPADSRRLSGQHCAGPAVLERRASLGRHVLRRRRPEQAATG